MANEPSVQIESLVGQLLLDVAAGVSVAEAVKQLRKAEGLTDDVEVHIAKQGQKLESNEILEVGQRFTAHFKNSHTITITFGDRIVNHVGMQQLGTEQDGLAASDILRMDVAFQKLGCKVKVIDLYKVLQLSEEPKQGEEALVLLVSGAVQALGIDATALGKDLAALQWDTRCYMKGRVVNKRARYNLCFARTSQEPMYHAKQGRVIAFDQVPPLARLKQELDKLTERDLLAEGNYYYNEDCYIGFHGDVERNVVVGCRFGREKNMTWQAFLRSQPVGDACELVLEEGMLYAMTPKAQGIDWRRTSVLTFRHAAQGAAPGTKRKRSRV